MAKIAKRGTGYCITIPKMILDILQWEVGDGVTTNIIDNKLIIRNTKPSKTSNLPTIEQLDSLGV